MGTDQKLMYAFRGWIAFVAFMDLGVAVRSYIEKRCFLGERSYTQSDQLLEKDDPTLPRILGMYSILKALALIHCTVFIHYRPKKLNGQPQEKTLEKIKMCLRGELLFITIFFSLCLALFLLFSHLFRILLLTRVNPDSRIVSMGVCSLLLTIIMYLAEAFYYHSTTLNFYVVFPCVLNGITLFGLMFMPKRLLEGPPVIEDENAELLRQAAAFRKRKTPNKAK